MDRVIRFNLFEKDINNLASSGKQSMALQSIPQGKYFSVRFDFDVDCSVVVESIGTV